MGYRNVKRKYEAKVDILVDRDCVLLDGRCDCPRLSPDKLPECRLYGSPKKKPHKGYIEYWRKVPFDQSLYPDLEDNLGFVIRGKVTQHPIFSDWMQTSAVVSIKLISEETDPESLFYIETLNSHYTLIGEEHV